MRDKILGGLYGQALGDAFAMPAQIHPDDTESAFGWLDSWQAAPPDHIVHAGLPAGRITDDSEQAFSIAQAIIDAGALTLAAVVRGLLDWYERVDGDNSPYVGPSTRRGLQALRRGADPRRTGLWGDTNGAAMRIAPIGLLHPGDTASTGDDRLRDAGQEVAALIKALPLAAYETPLPDGAMPLEAIRRAVHDAAHPYRLAQQALGSA